MPNLQLASSNDDESQRATMRVWFVFLSVTFCTAQSGKQEGKTGEKEAKAKRKKENV